MICLGIYIFVLIYGLCFALTYDNLSMPLETRFIVALLLEIGMAVTLALMVGLMWLGSKIHDHCPFGK